MISERIHLILKKFEISSCSVSLPLIIIEIGNGDST